MPALIAMPMFWGAVSAGATATGLIASAKMQSGAAKDAADVTSKAATDAAKLKAEGDAATLKYEQDQAKQTQLNAESTQHANYDQWASRQQRLSAYGQLFGAPAQDIPAYVPLTTLGATPTAPNAGQMPPGQSPSAFLKGLLDSGTDPQAAADQTNQRFNLQTGAQAKYYPPDGKTPPVIGLPDSYIAQTDGKWNLTMRSGGGAPSASAAPLTSLGAPLQAPMAPQVAGNLAMPTVGSLGSYFQTGAR